MSTLRLELDGRPGSFFEVELRGSELHVAFGPRDRRATPKARPFPSDVAARAELERLVALHKTKGYHEAVAAPPQKSRILAEKEATGRARERSEWLGRQLELAERPAAWRLVVDDALLAACEAAAPDDPAPWHVYADVLAAGGDPRGEIALGMLRGVDWEAGKVLAACLGEVISVEVRHGFLRTAAVQGDHLTSRLATFLATPFAASLRRLEVGLAELGDWTAALEVIAASPWGPRLRELVFDASDQLVRDAQAYAHATAGGAPDQDAYDGYDEYEQAYDGHVRYLDREIRDRLAAVCPVRFSARAPWAKLAGLERLVIDGPFRGDLGTLELPSLRELVIRSDRLANVAELANARCPKLETLELWFGDQVWSGEDGALDPTPLFAVDALPSVKTVRVFDAHEATLAMVRSSRLAKRATLVTTPPERSLAARYAHPQREGRLPLGLPRDGEPPRPRRGRAR